MSSSPASRFHAVIAAARQRRSRADLVRQGGGAFEVVVGHTVSLSVAGVCRQLAAAAKRPGMARVALWCDGWPPAEVDLLALGAPPAEAERGDGVPVLTLTNGGFVLDITGPLGYAAVSGQDVEVQFTVDNQTERRLLNRHLALSVSTLLQGCPPTPAPALPLSGPTPAPAPAPATTTGGGAVLARSFRVQSTKQPKTIDGIVDLKGVAASYQGTPITITDGALFPTGADPNMTWQRVAAGGNTVWTPGSAPPGVDEYMSFDFGADKHIDLIVVHNRTDEPWRQRATNLSLLVYNGAGGVVAQREFGATAQDRYEFRFA